MPRRPSRRHGGVCVGSVLDEPAGRLHLRVLRRRHQRSPTRLGLGVDEGPLLAVAGDLGGYGGKLMANAN